MLNQETTKNKLHIGVDARCLNTRHMRGMGKYVFEIMRNMADGFPVRWTMYADRNDSPLLQPDNCEIRPRIFDARGYRFRSWEQFALPAQVRKDKPDVLHCSASTLPYWQPVPTVVTIHDALPWQANYPDAYDRWYWYRLIPSAIKKCKAVITISESSRQDILSMWSFLEERVHVIPHGVNDDYLQAQTAPLSSGIREQVGSTPYLLYVGGVIERKRFSWAVQLMEALQDLDLNLVACGFTEEESRQVLLSVNPGIRGRICFLHAVPEQDMLALYRNAVAVLYPTLYEGFGFPALEAQAVGTPVLFSSLGSLRELQGPGAEILPPYELDAWIQALTRIYGDRARTLMPNESARKWAQHFSWKASAQKHMDVYRAVAESCAALR